MNRRFSLVLSVAAIAAVSAGCTTFSDSDNVARVGDVVLTDDEFQAQLTEADFPSDQLLPGDAVRAQITTWIQEEVATIETGGVDADEAAALYDAGFESSGVACINGIVVETNDIATRVADELTGGADFDELFAAENTEPSLGQTGGDLGCLTSDVVAENADIEIVQVATGLSADEPIAVAPWPASESAWVVLSFRPFDELSPAAADAVTTTIDNANRLANADVFVDPRYGTFDATTGQVVALG